MKLISNDFNHQETLSKKHEFNGFGGSGDNISPHLSWENIPEGTQSFAITVYDPDAPTGSGFWHWVAFDIPFEVNSLAENIGSPAVETPFLFTQSHNDFGLPGYGGACPPEGDNAHPYIFTVHALGVDKLGIDQKTPNAVARFLIHAHSLASASLTGFYQR
ncbi:hypothetical protein WB66_23350 [bacteria symbiont BFo1 of Frankliniella occidentalis]|nr:hypothetical protein AI28_16770 [bacteria symbiont BFo1 of Frankliniella occidentalis]KYP82460.1 hypothetical protein WB66_23350 [bacteria symbiont BFo1 of Frankliniella occidentalis]